jgi:hypothetical protein
VSYNYDKGLADLYRRLGESQRKAALKKEKEKKDKKEDKPWYIDTLEALQPTLDFVSRPQRMVTGAIYNATDGKGNPFTDFFKGGYKGLMGQEKYDTTHILDNLGWKELPALAGEEKAARDKLMEEAPFSLEGMKYSTPLRYLLDNRKDQLDIRDILEFGGDLALDPLNLTGFGGLMKAGGKLGYLGLKEMSKKLAEEGSEAAIKAAKADLDAVDDLVDTARNSRVYKDVGQGAGAREVDEGLQMVDGVKSEATINPELADRVGLRLAEIRQKRLDEALGSTSNIDNVDKNIELLTKRYQQTGSQSIKDQLDQLLKIKKNYDFFTDVSKRMGTNLTASGQRKAIERVSEEVYDDVLTKLGDKAGDNRVYTTRTTADGDQYVVDEGLAMVDGVKAEATLNPRLVQKLAEFKQNKMMQVADDAAKAGRVKYQNNLIGIDVPFFNIVYTLVKKPKFLQVKDPKIAALQVNALTKLMNEVGATPQQVEALRSGKATDEQIADITSKIGLTDEQKIKFIEGVTGKTDMSEITRQEYDEIVDRLQNVGLRQLDNVGQQQTVRTVRSDQVTQDYIDNLATQMKPLMTTKYAKEMETLRTMNPNMTDDAIIRKIIKSVRLPSQTGDVTRLATPKSPQEAIKKLGKKYSRLKSVSPKVRSLMEDIEYKFSLMDKPNDMLTDQFVDIIKETYSLGMKPYSQMRTKSPGKMAQQIFIDRPDLLEKLENLNRILDDEVGQYTTSNPFYRDIIKKLQKDLRDPSRRVKVGYNKDINETILANPKGVNIAELLNPTGERFWQDKTIDLVDSVATQLGRNKNFTGLDNSRFQIDMGGATTLGAKLRRNNMFNARTLGSRDENVNEMGNVIRDTENISLSERRGMEKQVADILQSAKGLTDEQKRALPYLLQKAFPDEYMDDASAIAARDKMVEMQDLKEELATLRKNKSQAKDHLAQIEDVKAKIAQAAGDLKRIRSESSYTQATKNKEVDLKELNDELQVLTQKQAQYESGLEKIKNLRKEIADVTNDLKKLRSEQPLSRRATTREIDLKNLKDRLANLTAKLSKNKNVSEEIKNLQQLIAKNSDELEQMRSADVDSVYQNTLLKIADGDEKVAEQMQKVANKMEQMYRTAADMELEAGSLKNTRKNYFPHVINYSKEDFEEMRNLYENDPEIGELIKKSSGNRFAKERRSYQTMAEVDNTLTAMQERLRNVTAGSEEFNDLEKKINVLSDLYDRDPFSALVKRYSKAVKSSAMKKMQTTFEKNGFLYLPSQKPSSTKGFKKLNEDEARALNLPNGTYVHQEVLDGIGKIQNVFTDKGMERLLKVLESGTNIFKTLTTTVMPSHYWYNFIGLSFNNLLAGVGTTAYRQATELIDAQKAGTLTEKQKNLIREMEKRGVLNQTSYADMLPSSTAQMDLEVGKTMFERGLKKTEKAIVDNPLTRGIRKGVADPMDNYFRMAHYLDVMSKTRNPKLAAESVRKYLFNYSELTTADRYMKVFMPFWNWTKNNIPLQIHKTLTTPRYAIAYAKIKDQTTEGIQNDPDMPDWVKDSYMKFGNELYNPRLPVQDLEALFSPNKFASSVSPAFRSIPELLLNKQFFTGKPIDYDAHYGNTKHISGEKLGEYLLKQTALSNTALTLTEDIPNNEDTKQWYDLLRDRMIGKSQNIQDIKNRTLENQNKSRAEEKKKEKIKKRLKVNLYE